MSRSGLRPRLRRGMTLLETLIATAIFLVVLAVAWRVLSGGVRSFYFGSSLNSAVQDAMILVERLDHDLAQLMVRSDTAGAPVWISDEGDELAFHIPAEGAALGPLAEAVPSRVVRYSLTPIPEKSGFWPTRDGVPMKRLAVRGWTFRHEAVAGPTRGMQFLTVEVEVAGLFGFRTYPLVRRVALPQAAAAARFGEPYAFVDRWIELDGQLRPGSLDEDPTAVLGDEEGDDA